MITFIKSQSQSVCYCIREELDGPHLHQRQNFSLHRHDKTVSGTQPPGGAFLGGESDGVEDDPTRKSGTEVKRT